MTLNYASLDNGVGNSMHWAGTRSIVSFGGATGSDLRACV